MPSKGMSPRSPRARAYQEKQAKQFGKSAAASTNFSPRAVELVGKQVGLVRGLSKQPTKTEWRAYMNKTSSLDSQIQKEFDKNRLSFAKAQSTKVSKPASMSKGSLVKKAAPKKAVAAKKPGMSKSGPRRASY
jgi:hypothetical protein